MRVKRKKLIAFAFVKHIRDLCPKERQTIGKYYFSELERENLL